MVSRDTKQGNIDIFTDGVTWNGQLYKMGDMMMIRYSYRVGAWTEIQI